MAILLTHTDKPRPQAYQPLCQSTTARELSDSLLIRRNMQLIREKMTIPKDYPHLVRPRLLTSLAEGLQGYGATVIAGRAGTGKTTLAADFARRYKHAGAARRVVWYTVNAPETDLRWFLQYLTACVAEQCPEFGARALLQVIQRTAAHDVSTLAELFAHELQKLTTPLLLIIDDLHLVYDGYWLTPFFYRLLTLLSEETQLLILARSLPPAPLWRLRSKQRLYVLTETELAFTPSEALELFAHHGLAAGQAGAALAQSHGRISALTSLVTRTHRATLAV